MWTYAVLSAHQVQDKEELGCEPEMRQPASRETTKVMHFQERRPSQRTTTPPLPLEGASRPSIRKIQAAQEPLLSGLCCHCQFHWLFFNYPCIPSPSATPAPPTPRLSHYLFSYADYIFKLNLQFNSFTTSKFSLVPVFIIQTFMYLTLLVSSTFKYLQV